MVYLQACKKYLFFSLSFLTVQILTEMNPVSYVLIYFFQATSGKPSSMVWVGGLPENYSKSEVEQAFDNFGAISNIVVAKSRFTGNNYTPGYAFIEFKKK